MEKNTTTYDVSRETIDKLKTYEASLNEWQNKFNLVSSSSLADGWNRHFLDSMQLFQYIPSNARTFNHHKETIFVLIQQINSFQ